MQFTLRTILLVMLFFAASMSMTLSMTRVVSTRTFGAIAGLLLAVYLLGACIAVKYAQRGASGLFTTLAVWMIVIPLVVLLLLPAVSRVSPAAYRAACVNNMKQLGIALFNYHDACGVYPPAYTTDVDGRPAHGWRALLSPWSEEFSETVDFTTPWNSDANRRLSNYQFYCYMSPGTRQSRLPGTTDYVAVVGEGTMWSTTPRRSVADPANTIMLIEIADSDIPWIEPRDLSLDEVLEPKGARNRPFATHHGDETHGPCLHPTFGPYHVLTADGQAHSLRVVPSRDELIQLFDPGPKSIKIAVIADRAPWPRPKWSVNISLVIMLASYVAICRTRLWPVEERYDS